MVPRGNTCNYSLPPRDSRLIRDIPVDLKATASGTAGNPGAVT